MTPAFLQWISVLAAGIIAVGTVAALLWGVWTYRRSSQAQVQLVALGMLQHYLDLAIAHPDLASRDERQPLDARYAWFATQALTTAQILWLLVGRQPAWQRAIDAVVRRHGGFVRSEAFVGSDYDPGFVAYLRHRADGSGGGTPA